MKILFVYSLYNVGSMEKPFRTPEVIQFGISYISSYLRAQGYETSLVILSSGSVKKSEALIVKKILEFKPSLISFTCVSTEYNFVSHISKYLKNRYPDIYSIVGGPHVSLNPKGVLDNFDALCIGEGEVPTLELVQQLEKGQMPSGIQNLWIKHGAVIEKNHTRPFLEDLDALPFPDRKMWEEWIEEAPGSRLTVLLGRGCPFQCTYCCNHALQKIAPGNYTRLRSPDNLLKEIKELKEQFPDKKQLYLEVETIGPRMDWLLELCSKLESFNKSLSEPLLFGTNIRVTPHQDLKTIFSAFKKGNFVFINIGLESGSEKIRNNVLRRSYSNKDIVNAVKLAREFGLQVSFLNMLGFPGETRADFDETIRINRICQPDWVGVSIFYPYPGTDLYALCQKDGLLRKPLPTEMERGRAVLNLPSFKKKQIENCYIWFEYNVYRGHRPTYKLLLRTIYLKIRTRPFILFSLRKLKNFLLKFRKPR